MVQKKQDTAQLDADIKSSETRRKVSLNDYDFFNESFRYESDTGKLYFKVRPRKYFKKEHSYLISAKNEGKEAGYVWNRKKGKPYIKVNVAYGNFYAHRIAWLLFYGSIPDDLEIDHINGDGTDNRISNLRLVNRVTNSRNMMRSLSNTSGVTGVWWSNQKKMWIAEIKVHRKKIHLGVFSSIELAKIARKDAEAKYKFHKNHGSDRLI